MHTLSAVLSGLSILMSLLLFARIQAPLGFMIWFPKLAASSLSPLWLICGLTGAGLGLAAHAYGIAALGLLGAGVMIAYILTISRPNPEFETAFGEGWMERIPEKARAGLLRRRWMGLLFEKDLSRTHRQVDLPFWTIPGSDRKLLCDLWRPGPDTPPSGLAFIFFHGSAWYMLDKDTGTRPFFSHLVKQGHTVMDVAYRLCPEVNGFEMVGDVYRAIAWMKAIAPQIGVDRRRIVLGGASAGGHLSMLAAYAPILPELVPIEILGDDLTVHGVVSLYGPCDLSAVYTHTNQQKLVNLPKVTTGPQTMGKKKNMQDAGRLDILVGDHLAQVPEKYALLSPIHHVHHGCPPTLLIQGRQDLITPIQATRSLVQRLRESGNAVSSIEFPCTDHGCDLLAPQISPTYQTALYAIDRFLAFLSNC